MKVLIWVPDNSLDALINHVQDLRLMSFNNENNNKLVHYYKNENSGCLQVELEFNDYLILCDNDIMVEQI